MRGIKMSKESLKVEIFDLLFKMEQLQAKIAELNKIKLAKLEELAQFGPMVE
jgi:hypothetical protein